MFRLLGSAVGIGRMILICAEGVLPEMSPRWKARFSESTANAR
jgi:hypothetical protein